MGKFGKVFKHTAMALSGRESNRHRINRESTRDTAGRAKKVGTALEVLGTLTAQPEVVAVGAGVSATAAASTGDVGTALAKTGKAAVGIGKATDDKQLQKRGQTAKKVGKTGKKIEKKYKQKKAMKGKLSMADFDFTDLTSAVNELSQEVGGLDLNQQQFLTSLGETANNLAQLKAGISVMDEEEQAVANELGVIAEEEELIAEEVDATNDLIQESMTSFLSLEDFMMQIDRENDLPAVLEFMQRQESNLRNLSDADLYKLSQHILSK